LRPREEWAFAGHAAVADGGGDFDTLLFGELMIGADDGIGAGVEHFVGEEGGVFVGGDAAVFLLPLFFVYAFGFEALEEVFAGLVAASFGVAEKQGVRAYGNKGASPGKGFEAGT
jgi:hypothetical protein